MQKLSDDPLDTEYYCVKCEEGYQLDIALKRCVFKEKTPHCISWTTNYCLVCIAFTLRGFSSLERVPDVANYAYTDTGNDMTANHSVFSTNYLEQIF